MGSLHFERVVEDFESSGSPVSPFSPLWVPGILTKPGYDEIFGGGSSVLAWVKRHRANQKKPLESLHSTT